MKYNTKARKKARIWPAVLLLAVVITAGAMELNGVFDKPAWKPDTVYPMANAKISWEQTFFSGAWDAEGR